MKALEKYKSILVALVVFILAIVAFNYIAPSFGGTKSGESAQNIGNDVVDLFQTLQSVTLDQSLFASSAYKLLNDFSTDIPAQQAGRHNPFDLIGR